MKKTNIIYQVDAFTDEPFKGNPAGVCILDQEPSEIWMQNIAMEMNLSETAFVFPGKDCRMIRFFTLKLKSLSVAMLHCLHLTYCMKPIW